jgi:hypothetical protein
LVGLIEKGLVEKRKENQGQKENQRRKNKNLGCF